MMNSLPKSLRVIQRGNFFQSAVRRFSTVPVTSVMVKELREKSGAPMMDCKKALSDSTVCGDMEKAMNWLRMKGIARAAQAERASQEGLIAFLHTPSVSTIIEVNSETDFVGKNIKFHSFVSMLAHVCNKIPVEGPIDVQALLKEGSATDSSAPGGETIADSLGDIVSQIRENIVIRRAVNISTVRAAGSSFGTCIAGYVHGRVGQEHLPANLMMGKAAALVVIKIEGEENKVYTELVADMGKRLSMHVVAASPFFLQPDQVPESTIATETAIFRQQTLEAAALKAKGKETPPAMLEKIIQGKVSKRLSDICLLNQPHVAEEGSPVVSEFLKKFSEKLGTTVSVSSFERWNLGQTDKQPTQIAE